MKTRQFGNTNMMVSEIGLGAWQLGNPIWGAGDPAEAHRIVHAAYDAGCNFFDTAPAYGKGLSEGILGEALEGVRDRVDFCTKFGHDAEGKTNFDASALLPSVEASLRRLRTDRLDVLLLHNPPPALKNAAKAPALHEELERLKALGKIRSYGVSLDSSDDLELITDHSKSQAAEVLFNAFNQETALAFAKAKARAIGLIIKVPLDSGWLAGRYRGDAKFTDVRDRWKPETIARRAALVEKLSALVPPGVSLLHASLRFILAYPEVATIIPGAKSVEQALNNIAVSNALLPAEVVKSFRQFWTEHLKDKPLPW